MIPKPSMIGALRWIAYINVSSIPFPFRNYAITSFALASQIWI